FPFACPSIDRRDDWFERTALGRQHILDSDGFVRDHDALDNTFVLKLFEPHGDQAVAQARNAGGELAEMLGSRHQRTDDDASPSPADKFNGVMITGVKDIE